MSDDSALGLLETVSLVHMVEGCDTMLKTARVRLVSVEKIGCAFLTASIRGNVASVRAALDAGAAAVKRMGGHVSVKLIARPHEQLPDRFPVERPSKSADDIICEC
jgi:ethanolamine utilization protein EutM